ncbi:MAG: ChaN family lipoprotein [Saprospiraceae bacterium]|nr:ChaN family lipoprotein [Saprospiraceae bacterium]
MTFQLIKSSIVNFIRIFLICPFLIICFQSVGQVTEKNYKIYSVKTDKEVSLNDISEDMKNYDVLFFGEEHNDSVAHYLENKMFEIMYQKFSNDIALSMEMFDRDVQPVMNEYLKGYIRDKHFTKDARIWSNYKDYKSMVEFAKSNNLNIICANAPTRYTNLAGRKGQNALMELSDESKKYFAPLPYDTASGRYYEKLMALTSHDASSVSDTSVKKMPAIMPMGGFNLILGQSLWDATMAYSISEYLKENRQKKVMQVNGRFHSDEGFAIATQLKKYRPETKSLIISALTDDSFPNIDWSKHKHLGDYIIVADPSVPKTFK